MRLWIVSAIFSVHLITTNSQFTFEYSESVCQRPWYDRMLWTNTPQNKPSSEVLRSHILMGKPVRAIIEVGNYKESFILDNLNMNGKVICGEALNRLSHPIDADAEFQPIIVCTDGYVSYLNSSAGRWDKNVLSHEWDVSAISFRSRDISPDHKPVTSRYLDGSSSMGFADNFRAMSVKSEMRGVMRDRGYAFNMENTHFDSATKHLSGQSLSYISQTYTSNGGIAFRNKPYHWLSSWETTGRRDSSRWNMGDMQRLRHTNDFVALQWYADACWTVVFRHDKTGKPMEGSIDTLRMYVKMGHRVRVNFDGYTLEANSVFVSPNGVIVAQTSAEMARRGGKGSDKTFFNTKTRQVYRLVHTNGRVRSFLYFIENGKMSAKSTQNYTITWSVDTRPWNPVLSMSSEFNVTLGSIRALATSMESSSLRVKLELKEKEYLFGGENSEMYLEINNVRTPDISVPEPEVIGQSLRTVPFYRDASGGNFHMNLYNRVKQYIEVSTKFGVTVSTFDMTTRDYKDASSSWPVESITWFKDDRILVP